MPETIAPCIHLNGTSRDELLINLMNVADRLRETIERLHSASPNGRDYYVGPHSLPEAAAQHMWRLALLSEVLTSIETELELISDTESDPS